MRQRSLVKRLWEILGPLILVRIIAFIVQFIVISIYSFRRMPEYIIDNTFSQEQITELTMEIMEGVYPYLTEIAALSALVAIPFLLVMMRRDYKKEQLAGIVQNKKASLTKYVLVLGISIPFSLGLNNILLLSNLAEYSEAYQQAAESLYTPSLPVQIVCVGMIIPIMEELVFRGLIYKRMRRNATFFRAAMYSCLFFGFYHGNAVQFIYAVLCGLLLAYLYEKYGSLKAPVLAHMCMNIVSCVLTEADVFTWMFSRTIRMAVITTACAALASAMFVLIRQIEERADLVSEKEESQDVVN